MTYQDPSQQPQYVQPIYKNPNKLDFGQVLFKPDGRIGIEQFWIGWLVILAGNLFLGWIPFVGLVFVWMQIVVQGKRLHDMGKTAWLQIIPMGISFGAIIVGFGLFIAQMIALENQYGDGNIPDEAMMGPVSALFLPFLIAGIVGLAFLLWIGISGGEKGPNKHGPDPREPFTGGPSTFA